MHHRPSRQRSAAFPSARPPRGAAALRPAAATALAATLALAACGGELPDGEPGDTVYSPFSVLSAKQVATYAKNAGIPCGDRLRVAVAVAYGESRYTTNAYNHNTNGTVDKGLWQINTYYHPPSCNYYDPKCNAATMVKISSHGTNWRPWHAYGRAAYWSAYNSHAKTGAAEACKPTCPLVSGAENELFKDMPRGSFGYSAAKKLYPKITKGCMTKPCLAFCPKDKVTRGQMAAFITRAKGWGSLTPSTPSFSDVPKSHTFYGAIERIYAKKITRGCGSGKFCPSREITRGQVAVFLVRALGLRPLAPSSPTFSDVPKSHMFYGAIERFAAAGITHGCGGGKFCPDRTLSRAEMAIFLVRAFRL